MKRPGYCTLCENPVFQVVENRIGPPLSNAWRVTFLLSDETMADMTFCSTCLPDIESAHGMIWEKVLERFDYDETQRVGEPSPSVIEFLEHIKTVSIRCETARILFSEAA